MDKGELGRRLADIREAAGLTQADLGQRLGVRQSTISAQETGVNEPSLHMIEAWSAACGRVLVFRFDPQGADPLSALASVARELPDADIERLTKIATALRVSELGERTRKVLTDSFVGVAEDARAATKRR